MADFGDDTQGTGAFPCDVNRAILTAFTAPASGTLTGAFGYFDAGSGAGSNSKLIIYSQTAGAPNALLAVSAGAAVPAGGGLVNLGAISGSIVSGTTYYVGFVSDNFQGEFQTDSSLSGIDTVVSFASLSYSSPPSTWPGTDSNRSDLRVNAYVTYSAGGTTYNDSISEAGSAADSLSQNAVLVASISEAGSAADALANNVVFLSLLTESGAANAAVDAPGSTYNASIVESGAASDVTDGTIQGSISANDFILRARRRGRR